MDEGTLKALLEAVKTMKECIMIVKDDKSDEYKIIHSELSNVDEWIEIIEQLKFDLSEKKENAKKNNNDLDNLLNNLNINLN